MRYSWLCRELLFVVFLIGSIYLLFDYIFYEYETNEQEYVDYFNLQKDEELVEKYLKQMQHGIVNARATVEKEVIVMESDRCIHNPPRYMASSREWTSIAGIHAYSAYYDDRSNSLFPRNAAIQLIVISNHSIDPIRMAEHSRDPITFYCNLFASNGRYSTTKGYVREIWQQAWDFRDTFLVPSLITCPLPDNMKRDSIDLYVGLTRSKCAKSQVAMKVIGKPTTQKKNDVAVCVKGLDYQEDISSRLIEWIESQFEFGVDKIGIYSYTLPSNVKKVLSYYQKIGKIDWTPLKLPPGEPNDSKNRTEYLRSNRPQKRRHELIPYNDCFYRYIYTHHYVLIIDIDELVVPLKDRDYGSLLKRYKDYWTRTSSLTVSNVFKFPSFTDQSDKHRIQLHHMTNNRKRSRKISKRGEYGKSFVSTNNSATVFNHFALHKLRRTSSKTIYMSTNDAIKLHYRPDCPWESRKECYELMNDVIDDTSLDSFINEIVLNTNNSYNNIFGGTIM